jgi:hypothetical protein
MKIRVHNPCNEHTRYYRNYNLFWDQLTDKLKEKYEVIENRYFEMANSDRFTVKFDSLTNESGLLLMECEYVIENLDNGEFYILSVSDILTQSVLVERSNPKLKKVLFSQFVDYEMKLHTFEDYEKYSPWIYFQSNLADLDYYYEKRKEKTEFIDKLCFWGTTSERPILKHFNSDILEGPEYIGDSDKYFSNLINYSVALSISGVGQLCYRDIECLALGVPLLKFEFQASLHEPLIPNYHYISVDYDYTIPKHNDVHTDRLGDGRHSKQLENRFKEVINDKEFLNFISNNARKYYEEHLHSSSRVDNTLKLLEL